MLLRVLVVFLAGILCEGGNATQASPSLQCHVTFPRGTGTPSPAPQAPENNAGEKPTAAQATGEAKAQAQEVAPVILPHRATYVISLYKNYGDEDVADAKGEMTIQLVYTGEGWAIEQKSTLHIYHKDGTAEQVRNTLTTWESDDGLKYSFKARTVRGDDEETIGGDAFIASKGGAGIVTYQQPDESTVQLPVGTVFPLHHMISMLTAAMRGQPVISHIVFDGSSETHEPVQVDTILGGGQDPKLVLNNKDLLQAKKVWPMRMAIYAEDSVDPEASYKIVQHVLDRGVIRDMTLDYGTFVVKAVLTQVEVFQGHG